MATPTNVKDFVAGYKPQDGHSCTRKFAILLHEIAAVLPGRWVDLRYAAKVVWGLNKLPIDDSDYVREKLPRLKMGARAILEKEFGCTLESEIEGVRATHSSGDVVDTSLRKEQARIRSRAKRFKTLTELIDPTELNREQKAEFEASTQGLKTLLKAVGQMPLLPPAKPNK